MVVVALGGMAATALLLVSAAVKFGWLGALHVLFTAIAVGVWFAAAYIIADEDEPEDKHPADERKED